MERTLSTAFAPASASRTRNWHIQHTGGALPWALLVQTPISSQLLGKFATEAAARNAAAQLIRQGILQP